ncbi:pyrroline-5-carboxylate reductase [Lawsonia intracellularis]|uniref:Pyrroline-5-carboxylate reductase n=1 Tax=Lawsonia intracellularis (strain PHE/MN1-00) TaxID=363253 RepID=Q1MPA3_LAWIP|nr:pyrroline-5-carboxylate reductase [Lawsonia intracellularis]AGC50557.1 pyrroline-5-carboxylate reductase [Lawsonia intracellularis N343]KAA0204573.1 pyrroline-5-carboxylate reductase [Lawsonia intracellularis]MBZ3893008.1 pyrroline-5-carboxylate reductase [Lawsonia intracellularis]RBN32841.1 pyrroline-5-carboxylate reductase [Lawsonia intracellularis]RBN35336.1 pyrroline-5-carboxylate reductase [Lawsonia intracellularis]
MLCQDSLVGVRVGCIGCGTMGSAILSSLVPMAHPDNGLILSGYNRTPEKLAPLEEKGVQSIDTIPNLIQQNDIIILGTKPSAVVPILKECLPFLRPGHIIISLAAGITQIMLTEAVESFCPVIRVMPNTPALVGSGIFALCLEDPKLSNEQSQSVIDLFSLIGLPIILPEKQFSAFTALIGCGPAYVFHFMDALVEAAVTLGFPRQQSIYMVSELLNGSAKLATQPGNHPALLREQVCSPGGITIAAINHMDRTAIRGNIIDAILTAYKKEKQLEFIE